MGQFIGRENEIRQLRERFESQSPELVVVYGRRRVGKTFLIRQAFDNRFDFYLTGLYKKSMRRQLENFANALSDYSGDDVETPKDWYAAFRMLKNYLQGISRPGKLVVFLDEVPWMETRKSDFVSALEGFWNGWGSGENNLLLILCGSATSWITKKVFSNKGGLFNRDTDRIYLEPFTLKETEEFLDRRQICLTRKDIAECYMIMGGIPYYLDKIKKGMSFSQNIDNIFFKKRARLWDEFTHLYASLFDNPEPHLKIVKALNTKRSGLTRAEISEATKIPPNGNLTRVLKELEDSGFVLSYKDWTKTKKGNIYRLSDFYTIFYLDFVQENYGDDENFWTNRIDSSMHRAWTGFAFELLCMNHIPQIKAALGISGVATRQFSWRGEDKSGKRSQIDLLIDRRDGVIDLCEVKFASGLYAITKGYESELVDKIEVFRNATKTNKSIHLVMVTTFGLSANSHTSLVQNSIILDDLFLH